MDYNYLPLFDELNVRMVISSSPSLTRKKLELFPGTSKNALDFLRPGTKKNKTIKITI